MKKKEVKSMLCSIIAQMPVEVIRDNSSIFSVRVNKEAQLYINSAPSVVTVDGMLHYLMERSKLLSSKEYMKDAVKGKSRKEAERIRVHICDKYRDTAKFLKLVCRDMLSHADYTIKECSTPSTKKSKLITKNKGGKTK